MVRGAGMYWNAAPTAIQRDIVRYILEYREAHPGYTPTYREIAAHLGVTYTTAHNHVMRLLARDWLQRDEAGRLIIPASTQVLVRAAEGEENKAMLQSS